MVWCLIRRLENMSLMLNLSNANVNTGRNYQIGDLRLTRHGNMLHRFLPVQLDYKMSLTVRPNCFDETSHEGYRLFQTSFTKKTNF